MCQDIYLLWISLGGECENKICTSWFPEFTTSLNDPTMSVTVLNVTLYPKYRSILFSEISDGVPHFGTEVLYLSVTEVPLF